MSNNPADPGQTPWGWQPPTYPAGAGQQQTPPPFPQMSPPPFTPASQPPFPPASHAPGPLVPYGSAYLPSAYAAAPYGVDPVTGLPYSDKSKVAAGVLQLLFGGLGVGRFYMGHIGMGIAQIAVTFITLGFGVIWPFIDGIVILAGSPRDAQGRPLRP